MADRKKVDRKRNKIKKQIRLYKKNNKALCDILTLYSYCFTSTKVDFQLYMILDKVIEDLEDKEVTVPLKAESIHSLLQQDWDKRCSIRDEIRKAGYNDLDDELIEDYRVWRIESFFKNRQLSDETFDFIGDLCEFSPHFVSEILCSNMEMSKRIDILYDIIMYYKTRGYVDELNFILVATGAGMDLSRTLYEHKEKKMEELIVAFRQKMEGEQKVSFFNQFVNAETKESATHWLSYFQEKKMVDFMNIKGRADVDGQEVAVSPCVYFGVSQLYRFQKFYQLEDYLTVPEEIRRNDNAYILSYLKLEDIASFIALSHYEVTSNDLKRIGNRVMEVQIKNDKARSDLIMEIKNALFQKSTNNQEYEITRRYAQYFEKLTDYEAYKKEEERKAEERAQERERRKQELHAARYEVYLRLYNMNESLQEQVPGKKHLNELVFQKDN